MEGFIIKIRKEPTELKMLKLLNSRTSLSAKDKNNYHYLEKGFEGEKKFDAMIGKSSEYLLIIPDLLFEYQNTTFQIDSLVIAKEEIYLFEIKNNERDHYFKDDNWYLLSGKEIKNPLLQLKRSESLLRRLLQSLGFQLPIKAYLVFVNPHFFLYQAPMKVPIIFHPQLKHFIDDLKAKSLKLTDRHENIAKKLLSLHIEETTFHHIPEYAFEQLKKGITCIKCSSFMKALNLKELACEKCGTKERSEMAILRSIDEFHLLFPDRKITTNGIYEWCEIIHSKKMIRRILTENYTLQGHGRSAHYVRKNKNTQ